MLFIKFGIVMSTKRFFRTLLYSVLFGTLGGIIIGLGKSLVEWLPDDYLFIAPLSLFILAGIIGYVLYRHRTFKKVYLIAFLACWMVSTVVLYLLDNIWLASEPESIFVLITKTFGMSILITVILLAAIGKRKTE